MQRKKEYVWYETIKESQGVQQISKEFAYPSYFKDTLMGLLGWSNYKIFVGNYERYNHLCVRQNY